MEAFIHIIHGTEADTNYTSRQGRLTCKFNDLIEVFGQPLKDGFDTYKCDAQWDLDLRRIGFPARSTVAAIYNYKNGQAYCRSDAPPVRDITDWSVGGHSHEAVQLIETLLKQNDIEHTIQFD